MPVVCIAPRDPWHEKMISQIQQAKARGGTVIAVATEGDELVASQADHVLVGSRLPLDALAGCDGHSAADPGLPYRHPARPGCGPAAQPGQERDGRIAEWFDG